MKYSTDSKNVKMKKNRSLKEARPKTSRCRLMKTPGESMGTSIMECCVCCELLPTLGVFPMRMHTLHLESLAPIRCIVGDIYKGEERRERRGEEREERREE